MRWMVSYELVGRMSGNRCFDTEEEAEQYIADQRSRWTSATLLTYIPHWSSISTLTPVRQIVARQRCSF